MRLQSRRGLIACVTAALVSTVILAVVPTAAHAATQPAPSVIGLQQSDVPGFAAQDPDNISISDPGDQGPDQAFIQCAQGVPLLSQFDTGADATESPVYGQGQNPFGTPELAVASAVFADGQPSDAYSAYQTLASTKFQQCWAATMDQLNQAQGITPPTSPTTVTSLSVPAYGQGSSGFAMNVQFDALGVPVSGQYGISVIYSGDVVAMLVTITYESSFPDSVRLSVLANIAQRMGAATRSSGGSTGPTHGGNTSSCLAPDPLFHAPLLTSSQVNYTLLSDPFVFDGWSDAAGSDPVRRTCEWISAGTYSHTTGVYLGVTAPFGVGQANQQFEQDLKMWQPTTTVSSVGDDAFWLPYTDTAQGIEVLSGDRIITISIEAPSAGQARHEQNEITLARDVIDALGNGQKSLNGPTPPLPKGPGRPTPPADNSGDDQCGFSASLGLSTDATEQMDKEINRFASNHLPVSAAEVTIPGGLWLAVAPSFEPGDITFCSAGLTTALTHTPPWSDPGSTLGVQASGKDSYGGMTYSSELASWTQLSGYTPPDQQFQTKFDPALEVSPDLSVDIGKDGLDASLTLAEVDIGSAGVSLELVDDHSSILSVELGPDLAFDLEVTKKDLVDEIAKDLKEGEGEETAEKDVAEQAAEDDAVAIDVDAEGYYGMSSAEIEAQVDAQIGPKLIGEFQSWFQSLNPASPDVEELEDQGVTADDVSAADAAAFEEEGAGAFASLGCDLIAGGPEDLLGDVLCLAASA
jgi:hypothetical protein